MGMEGGLASRNRIQLSAMKTERAVLKHLLRFLAPLVIVLFSVPAFAFGTVTLKSANLDEVDGRWKLEMEINYGSTPEMGHIPFDFVFTMNTYYEYSITDTDKEPVIRPKPMVNQPPTRESVDIDFADARNKIWPRTKFQIGIKRDRGFEAGEHTLVIKRASDGATMGQPMKLRFNGKNKLVDRRAVVFGGPSGKDADAGAKKDDKDKDKAEETKKDEAAPTNEETPTEAKTEEPAAAPPPVEKRAGSHGCGCRAAGSTSSPTAAAALATLAAVMLAARRRRR